MAANLVHTKIGKATFAEADQARGPGRKRNEAARQAILRTAYEILAAEGYGGFTIERLAARSGAAKTTIYRWWPSKGVLAIESFLPVYERGTPIPHSKSAVQDLKAHMRLQAKLWDGSDGRILMELIAAGESDPAMKKVHRDRILIPRREAVGRMLRRGIEQGEFRMDVDIETATDALYGPYYACILAGIGPCDAKWADRLCDTVLHGLMAQVREDAG
jgi:AcrR family transcriptional regulator